MFDGSDYVHERDSIRLSTQLEKIKSYISDGEWYSLDNISAATNSPHSSVSAQLRNMRKPRFGGCIIEKQYMGNGLYHYRLNK